MTPAIRLAKKQGIVFHTHPYDHDPANTNFGVEAAEALGVTTERVFKTLLFALNGDPKQLAVAVVPVSGLLDLKAAAKAAKGKKADMAYTTLFRSIWPIRNWLKKLQGILWVVSVHWGRKSVYQRLWMRVLKISRRFL